MTSTVVIADDHPVLRQGVRAVIERLVGFRVVAEASDGFEAIDVIRAHEPDVAIVDVSMPELDGLEVLQRTAHWSARPAFVMLTMHEEYVARATASGALGYLLKEDAVAEIEPCLRAVTRGRTYLSSRLPRGAERAPTPTAGVLASLSPAELRVLRLVAQHKTSREIASVLCLSHRTVQNHRARTARKLGLSGTQALLRFALACKDQLDRSPA